MIMCLLLTDFSPVVPPGSHLTASQRPRLDGSSEFSAAWLGEREKNTRSTEAIVGCEQLCQEPHCCSQHRGYLKLTDISISHPRPQKTKQTDREQTRKQAQKVTKNIKTRLHVLTWNRLFWLFPCFQYESRRWVFTPQPWSQLWEKSQRQPC